MLFVYPYNIVSRSEIQGASRTLNWIQPLTTATCGILTLCIVSQLRYAQCSNYARELPRSFLSNASYPIPIRFDTTEEIEWCDHKIAWHVAIVPWFSYLNAIAMYRMVIAIRYRSIKSMKILYRALKKNGRYLQDASQGIRTRYLESHLNLIFPSYEEPNSILEYISRYVDQWTVNSTSEFTLCRYHPLF